MLSGEDSDSDEETIYALGDPILNLQMKIVERLSLYNYLRICVNVGWLVDAHLLDGADVNQKIALGVLVLDSIHVLRPMRDIHFSMLESLYALAEHPDKLARLRKRVSWYSWIMSWVH